MGAETTELPASLPAKNPDVEAAFFPGAIVVFDIRSRMAHELIGTPAVVFDACCDGTTTATLVDELVAGGIANVAAATALIEQVLRDLDELGLLEGSQPPAEPPPCIDCGASVLRTSRWWFRRR